MSFHTQRDKILSSTGKTVLLKGVSRTGLEYGYVDLAAMIPETIEFDLAAMKKWGFNSVRFPLRDRFWLEDADYRDKIKFWVDQTIENDMHVILDLHTQQDHPGQDPFMLRSDTGIDALAMWVDIAKTYNNTPRVFFEVFNEPHDISPIVWWDGDATYYGYKQVLDAIREHANNICIIGGLDYAYQLNFIQHNKTLLDDMKRVPNLALSVHPYGYKGAPVNNGTSTAQIPTTILHQPANHTGDCHLGVTVPDVPRAKYGWDESFGFVARQKLFPLIATEWGLDRPDNCIQGGWYNVELLDYINSLSMGYMAWAWVQDRLDYPSLLDTDFNPTGKGNKDTIGPACSGPTNHFYQGPGILVFKDLQQPHHHRHLSTTNTTNDYFFLRNLLLLSSLLALLFSILPFKKRPLHRVVSNTQFQKVIRICSSQSLLEMN